MVRSIEFTGKSGFIGERWGEDDKPEKVVKEDFTKQHFIGEVEFDSEGYEKAKAMYREGMKMWRKLDGKYKVACSEGMIGRRFEFVSDRINLIFGPNGSGKSTILRGIASHALTFDGYSQFIKPLEFNVPLREIEDVETYFSRIGEVVLGMCRAESVVEWDGSPVYFHNFEERERRSTGSFGELTGSVLGNVGEEVLYHMERGKHSLGENGFNMFYKIVGIMGRHVTYEDILKPYLGLYGSLSDSNPWRMAYDAQEKYYRSFPKAFDPDGINTFLLDEIDKSMDIVNVDALYTKVLPAVFEKFGRQIIVISHSPLVLRDSVYGSDMYNFISMDEEYTEKCRRVVKSGF